MTVPQLAMRRILALCLCGILCFSILIPAASAADPCADLIHILLIGQDSRSDGEPARADRYTLIFGSVPEGRTKTLQESD